MFYIFKNLIKYLTINLNPGVVDEEQTPSILPEIM